MLVRSLLDKIRLDPKDLWVRTADLPRVNEFELKPEGACRADMCIPVAKGLRSGEWFNLSGFARKLGESLVTDSGVWSFGEAVGYAFGGGRSLLKVR